MNKYLAAFAGVAVVMVALDMFWLGIIAKPLYQQGIGHLMAESPNVGAVVARYSASLPTASKTFRIWRHCAHVQ